MRHPRQPLSDLCELLALIIITDLSYKQIAQTLNYNINTVSRLAHRYGVYRYNKSPTTRKAQTCRQSNDLRVSS